MKTKLKWHDLLPVVCFFAFFLALTAMEFLLPEQRGKPHAGGAPDADAGGFRRILRRSELRLRRARQADLQAHAAV